MEIKNYFELGKIAFGLFLMRKQILTFFSDLAKDYYDEYVDKIDKTQKISMSDTKYMKLIQSFIDNEDAYNDFINEYSTEETSDENVDITDVYDMSLKIAYLNYRFSKDSKIDEKLIQRLKDLEYNLLMKLLKNMINH